jgi:hypothetical protein
MPTEGVALMHQLHSSGWTMADAALFGLDGRLTWVVSGRNDGNRIRAESPTCTEAWRGAVEQARSFGILETGEIN